MINLKSREIIFSGDGKNRDLLAHCTKNDSVYIAMVTPTFLNGENCILEVRDAAAKGLKLYAFLLEGSKLPKILRKLKWEQITPCSTEQGMFLKLTQLLEDLKII